MSKRLLFAAFLAASPALAQDVRLTPEQTMGLAAQLMRGGEPAKARVLAEVLLERDETDVPALILAAEASIATGDMEAGRSYAQSAWALADVDAARFASARLTALAHAQNDQFTRSQFWLRRARHFAPDENTSASVAEDYRYVRRMNPFQFRLDFSVAPTDNLNNGTTNETISLAGLPIEIVLSPDSQPLSGTEFTASGRFSWRLHETPTSLTRFELSGVTRQYRLSSEAKDLAPDAKAGDFSEMQLSLGLTHLWNPNRTPEPWRFALSKGRFFYGGDPYSDFARVSVARGVRLGDADRLDATLTGETTTGLSTADSDAVNIDLRWTHAFDDLGNLQLGLTGRSVTSEVLDHQYEAVGGQIGWTFADSGVGVSYSYEEREYTSSIYVAGARTDRRRTLRLSAPIPGVEMYGFQPVINAEHVEQNSNAARYETSSTGAGITFRSAF